MSLLDPAFAQPSFQWDRAAARHLLNRAGFGVPPEAVDRLAAMKPADAVAAFVDYEKYPDQFPEPDWLGGVRDPREMREKVRESGMSEDERRRVFNVIQREDREDVQRLQMWWIDRMCHTDRPLEEKMTLFWHGHFACSAEKVKEPTFNYGLNKVLRQHATGNFRTLVSKVGQSPAMLRYLDNVQNRKGKPNENWARELMELFALGIGNYTETDIKEAARSFTGWMHDGEKFVFNRRQHDDGVKTVLGESGKWNGEDVIDIIFRQPAMAPFICTKLWKFFAYEEPEAEVIDGLAATFRSSNHELKPVLRQMFSSQAFYSAKARASQVKSPAQLVVNLQVQLGAELSDRPPLPILAMRAMGQSLYYPPNVKGWDGGKAWINTTTLLTRCNFANYLVSGTVPDFSGGRGGGNRALERLRRAQQENTMESPAEGMMEMQQEESVDMAGQDAMPRDIPTRTLANAIRNRRGQQAQRGGPQVEAPFDARAFFARYQGMTPAETVDALCDYFLSAPLPADRRDELTRMLAGDMSLAQPLAVQDVPEERLRAVIQLLLSTAEYQVC